jgi:hypothetical protein
MTLRTCTLAFALAFGITGAYAADPTYKSTMPNGRVVYSDSPQPGAKRVEKVATPAETTGVLIVNDAEKMKASNIPPPPGPGVAVIPEKPRSSPLRAQQGYESNVNQSLPSRTY